MLLNPLTTSCILKFDSPQSIGKDEHDIALEIAVDYQPGVKCYPGGNEAAAADTVAIADIDCLSLALTISGVDVELTHSGRDALFDAWFATNKSKVRAACAERWNNGDAERWIERMNDE
jgi:hypothetical protein